MSIVTRTVVVGGTVAIILVARSAFPLDGLTSSARAEIPDELVGVYKAAAKQCRGLPWQTLAGIGWVASRHAGGAADPVTGDVAVPIVGPALDGSNGSVQVRDRTQPDGWAHPLGPMGLLPSAWARFATLAPGRPAGATPSVQNVRDAIYTTANELCRGAPLVNDLNLSIRVHNPQPLHVMEVLLKSARYGHGTALPDVDALVAAAGGLGSAGSAPPTGSGRRAVVAAALRVLGTPYVWGAESPAEGFDCSGLVWWAYRQAGVAVARTTDDQVRMGVGIRSGELQPGDLLFTRGGQQVHDLGHVAIYAGDGYQVIAPRSGKSVTVQPVDLDEVQAVRRILAS
ncbi:MAG: NlpC/P60 family protein [Acidimicrobiales bacterium]